MSPSDSWPFAALAARWFLQAQVSRVAHTTPCSACRSHYPGRPPVRLLGQLLQTGASATPKIPVGTATTLWISGPAQASRSLRPADSLDLLSKAFVSGLRVDPHESATAPDSYRGGPSVPRAGFPPAGGVHLSRRTEFPHKERGGLMKRSSASGEIPTRAEAARGGQSPTGKVYQLRASDHGRPVSTSWHRSSTSPGSSSPSWATSSAAPSS